MLADGWRNEEGKHWTMTDVANFSMRPIRLLAGTPLAEAEWAEDDWVCSVVEPGVVEGLGTPFDGLALGSKVEVETHISGMAMESKIEVETPVDGGALEGTSEAPYHNTLSWEPVAAATAVDINGMVGRVDMGLLVMEVEHL